MPDMRTATFAAGIFDLDSTLVDSWPAVERCWTDFAFRYGLTPKDFAGSHGRSTAELVAHLVAPERQDEALAWITARELADQDGVVALPGSADALTALADHAAVATSAAGPLARARLEAAGLPVPDVVVTADDVPRAKPDPAIFLLAAQRLGADPADALVAEDSPNGLVAARRGGMATVAVTTTHRAEELTGLADVVVPDLGHLTWALVEGRVSARRA